MSIFREHFSLGWISIRSAENMFISLFFQFLQSFAIMNFHSESVSCPPRMIRPIHKIHHTLQFPHGILTNGSIQGTFVNASIITSSTLLCEQVHKFTLTDETNCIYVYFLKNSFLCDTIFSSFDSNKPHLNKPTDKFRENCFLIMRINKRDNTKEFGLP